MFYTIFILYKALVHTQLTLFSVSENYSLTQTNKPFNVSKSGCTCENIFPRNEFGNLRLFLAYDIDNLSHYFSKSSKESISSNDSVCVCSREIGMEKGTRYSYLRKNSNRFVTLKMAICSLENNLSPEKETLAEA